MTPTDSREIKISTPIGSILKIEAHILSTRTADLYRGIDCRDGTSLIFWFSRSKLAEPEHSKFLNRLSTITALKLPSCPIRGYGIDSEGKAFALFPFIDCTPIVSCSVGAIDVREAERRYILCLQTLRSLHQAGIILGDLCQSSFVLDRSGRVLFLGVMGGVEAGHLFTRAESSSQLDQSPGGLPELLMPETLQFIAPEQRAGQVATQASDVFAFGVMSYRLFATVFPFSNLSNVQLANAAISYPAAVTLESPPNSDRSSTIPSWCNDVFFKCLNLEASQRYANIPELDLAVQTLRQKTSDDFDGPALARSKLIDEKISKKDAEARTFQAFKEEKKAGTFISFLLENKIIIGGALLGLLMMGLSWTYLSLTADQDSSSQSNILNPFGLDVFGKGEAGDPSSATANQNKEGSQDLGLSSEATVGDPNSVEAVEDRRIKRLRVVQKDKDVIEQLSLLSEAASDPKLRDAINVMARLDSSLEERTQQLAVLIASEDPIAHQALIASAVETSQIEYRQLLERALMERVTRLGGNLSVEQLRQWLATIQAGPLPEIYEAILKSVNPRQPLSMRESLLRQAYPNDPTSVLLLVAALSLDSSNPQEFQPVVAQLVGDSLSLKDASEKSLLALLLAQPEIADVFGEAIMSRKTEFLDSDLPWVLTVLAVRNDYNVRQFAQMTLERGQVSSLRKVFLEAIKERDDLSLEVVIALVKAGSGTASSDDIAQFGLWVDVLSERVLLALCGELQEPKLLQEAFDTLAAKPLSSPAVVKLVEIIRRKYWEQRSEFAPLLAVIGLPGVVSEKAITPLVDKLSQYVKDTKLIEIFATSDDPILAKAILERFFEDLSLGTLLKLLRSNDKETRIKAILALKRYNEIGALKLIIAQYNLETDPEVIQVYKNSFWMIAERSTK